MKKFKRMLAVLTALLMVTTMTAVPVKSVHGSTGDGEFHACTSGTGQNGQSATENVGYGNYTPWNETVYYHSNFPDGVDFVNTVTYSVKCSATMYSIFNAKKPSDYSWSYPGYEPDGLYYSSASGSANLGNYGMLTLYRNVSRLDVYIHWTQTSVPSNPPASQDPSTPSESPEPEPTPFPGTPTNPNVTDGKIINCGSGTGDNTWEQKVIFHSNYPDGTDYTVTYIYKFTNNYYDYEHIYQYDAVHNERSLPYAGNSGDPEHYISVDHFGWTWNGADPIYNQNYWFNGRNSQNWEIKHMLDTSVASHNDINLYACWDNVVPPASEPPTDEPPASESPTEEPPASESPTEEPPASESPTNEPDPSVPPAPDGMGTITVVNPRANKTYNAYRVFDLVYSTGADPTSYAYSIKHDSPWFGVIQDYANNHDHGLKLTPTAANPDLYVVEFASAENSIEGYEVFDPVDFAAYLRDHMPENAVIAAWRNAGSTPTGPIKLTTDGNAPGADFNNVYVPLGYYFVTTSIGTFCSLDSADPDAYIYDKNEVPGWDTQPGSTDLGKVVAAENPESGGTWGKTTVETIGSEAWFKIMAHVPAYEYGHQVEQYTFTDTLGDGFTYDANSLKITLYTGLDTTTGEPIAEPNTVLYDSNTNVQGVTVTLPSEGNNKITVKLQLTGENAIDLDGQNGDENYYPDAHIVIEYTAHVDKDAVHDNANTAKMEWSWDEPNPVPNPPSAPTPEQPAVPEDVHTDTYVYGFPFNKTIKDSNPPEYLSGAEFKLYSDPDCTQLISLVVDNELPEGAPAQEPEGSVQWTYYRVADAAETTATGFASETIEAGRAVIWGLEPGTYYLLETKAPDGYNLLTTVFPITICAEDDPNTQDVNEVNVDEHGYVNVETFNVENASGAELPSTGGIGTTIFYIAGALLMTAAVVLLVVKKKMSVQE